MPTKLISIGELIDQTWERYREHLGSYLSISSWVFVAAVLNIIAITFYPSAGKILNGATLSGVETFGVFLYGFSSLILTPLINVLVLIGIIRMATSVLSGRGPSLHQAVGDMKKKFWPTVLVSLMYAGIIFLAVLLPLLPAGFMGLISFFTQSNPVLTVANILLALGIFTSVILVVRWGLSFYLAPYLVVQNGEKPRSALTSSHQLIIGRFWSMFLRIIAPKIVFILFGFFIMWFFNLMFLVLFSGISGLNLDLQVRLTSFSDELVPILATMLINPLIIISDVLLMKNLKQT